MLAITPKSKSRLTPGRLTTRIFSELRGIERAVPIVRGLPISCEDTCFEERPLPGHLHLPVTLLHLGYMPQHEPVPGHHVKQRQFGNNCFGCGPANETGLKLKFVLDEKRQRFVCRFRLQGRFVGPPAHAHGGIIATILDEAMGKVNRLHGIVALTSTMDLTYLKPVPLFKPLIVEGWEKSVRGRQHYRAAEIRSADGQVLASSKGKFIEIDPTRMFAKYLKKKHSDAT